MSPIQCGTLAVLLAASAASFAQQPRSVAEELERYRAALGDDNPAELWEARGEGLWKEKRGPKNASLEQCDLGLGPGVVKGVYTVLPKYFKDTDKVEDLESRLVTCMVTLQGFTPEEAKKRPFGNPYEGTAENVPMDALVAYVVTQSRGMTMNVAGTHPREREAFELGRKIFFFRGGTHDFSCASCHGADGKRIRLQELPNLTKTADVQRAYGAWPAYRLAHGNFRSFQWRVWDCFRQQRFPELEFVSPASIALTMYLAKSANGGVSHAPTIKR
jgi:sulfur-oxidizing protein SoxA